MKTALSDRFDVDQCADRISLHNLKNSFCGQSIGNSVERFVQDSRTANGVWTARDRKARVLKRKSVQYTHTAQCRELRSQLDERGLG